MPVFLVNTNPKIPVQRGVGHDGAFQPWIGDVLVMDALVNRMNGFQVGTSAALWSNLDPMVPSYWPLNGRMQGE